jgi:hypothetical protein
MLFLLFILSSSPMLTLPRIYGSYNPNTPPVGTVVNVRVIMAEIAWLARRIDVSDQVGSPPPRIGCTVLTCY